MIGADHERLMDSPHSERSAARLGGPLLLIIALFAVWISGRAVFWENPYAQSMVSQASRLLAENSADGRVPSGRTPGAPIGSAVEPRLTVKLPTGIGESLSSVGDQGPALFFDDQDEQLAAGHFMLWQAALTSDARGTSWRARRAQYQAPRNEQANAPVFPGQPPFVPEAPRVADAREADRLSLGAWVFARDGSLGSVITPGPAPVYGASQMGANLQYRFAPRHRYDPRAYIRATRALIDQGETEIAGGLSARPIGSLPLRVAAEIRATDNALGRDLRPSAFSITELPPQPLPLDLTAEVYAAAGYVGGEADTFFADGLATVTRGITSFDLRRVDDVRVSLGAGAWGGAQRGVHRVDIGPTLRVDMALGSVPARVSIDYRERVGGEARPTSGVAATLSTQF